MKRRLPLWPVAPLALACAALCVLVGPTGFELPDWRTQTGAAILGLRLNRVLAGFTIGAALACAGTVMQAILRNPLAEPYVLGVSSGAGLGAALAILSGLAAGSIIALPAVAFVFAAATLVLVYAMAGAGRAPGAYSLLLSGVIVSAMASSLLMLLVSLAPVEGLHGITWWMLGNLQTDSTTLLYAGVSLVAAGCLGAWMLGRELNALTLGHEAAYHAGVRPELALGLGLAAATMITAVAVSLGGLIGFVGLIVPHALRSMFGPDNRRLIPACAMAGGAFLVLCDALARTLLGPVEIPVGVITSLSGGPFFLFLLHRRRSRGWLE